MKLNPDQFIPVLTTEAFHHRKAVVAIFIVVNLLTLTLAVVWPKGYSASTTILVEDKKIIQPLMQGAAVTTDVADRSRLARDVIFGRKIMNQILQDAGWLKDSSKKVGVLSVEVQTL